MFKIKKAPTYDDKWLEVERPQPLTDQRIDLLIQDVIHGKLSKDISENVYTDFKNEVVDYILGTKINNLTGLDNFARIDIINGCTQFIDDIYMNSAVQVLHGDYQYHSRLGLAYIKHVQQLIPSVPLIIALPFPSTGSVHQDMTIILQECVAKNIPVHVDGAWLGCSNQIDFNFDHPIIQSVGISLSKGLGLGWNRIGIRFTRQHKADSISLMNDYHMNQKAVAMIGLHFVRSLPVDYLWNKYSKIYEKICKDFNLSPTNSIHIALRNGQPVGVSPLIRYLENESD